MSSRPKLSIIVPTYNRRATVQRTIRSLNDQTFRDFEIVLIDDGSTDDTEAVVRRMNSVVRIRYLKHDRNKGVCAAKNTGLNNIRGEWFGILDSDDELVPEALETLLAVPDKVSMTIDVVACNCVDTGTNQLSGKGLESDQFFSLEDKVLRCEGEFWGILRTDLLGGDRLNESIPGLEDTLWYKLLGRATAYYVHQGLRIYHTEGDDRISKQNKSVRLEESARVYGELLNEIDYLEVFREYRRKRYRKICVKGYMYGLATMNRETARGYRRRLDEEDLGITRRISLALLGGLGPVLPRMLIRLTRK